MDSRNRNQMGQFVPGHKSQGGRPKGFGGLMRGIQEATNEGRDLWNYAMEVWTNPNHPMHEKHAWDAFVWLTERGYGKAVSQHEIHAQVTAVAGPTMPAEIALGSVEDRIQWLRVHAPHLLTD